MTSPHPRSPALQPARRTLAALAALLAGSQLAACESSPRITTAEQRIAATPSQHSEYATLGYRVEWRGFPALSPGNTIKHIEVLGDIIAVQEGGAEVSILEARSGERRWSDPVDNRLTRFVGLVRDGKRLIVSSEAQAYFFDLDTGALLAKQPFATVVNTRPVQFSEILVYGTANGQALGHLTLNGFRQWGSSATDAIDADPVALGDTGLVAVYSSTGDLLILEGITGSLRGRNRTFGGTDAPIAASGRAVYIASTDHSLYAFSADQADLMWRIRTEAPLRFAPVVHDDRVYCDMGASGLTAFEADTGKVIWANKSAHGSVVAVRNGRLIAFDGATATTIDPARGSTVDSVKLDRIRHIRTDQFVDGHLYLASDTGIVTKLTPRN